jgi:hypothetical protein
VVYVDDSIVISNKLVFIQGFKSIIQKESEMSNEGEIN